jgi:hypothetical protein
MVRAAVSGAVDYSRADPTDTRWRIKHRLVLLEMQRRENQHVLEYTHRHWCAYLAHGGLTEDSFGNVKKNAGETLTDLQNNVFPWNAESKDEETSDGESNETEAQNSKIDPETKKMIEKFKVWRQGQPVNKTAES